MNQAKRVFTIEFKQECVNLVLNQGYSVMQAAGAMGIGESTLQRWVRQYRKELTGITPQASAITPEQQQQPLGIALKKAGFKVTEICRHLCVPRSSYYRRSKPKLINPKKVRLKAAIGHIHQEMDATYGNRRMRDELQAQGFKVGRYKVRSLMKALTLKAKRPKAHRYPASGRASVTAPNTLNRQFNPNEQNTHWSGDITYIRTHQTARVITAHLSH